VSRFLARAQSPATLGIDGAPLLECAGIVGRGNLGEGVARRAEALGMKVLFAERKGALDVRPGYAAFREVIAESDAITLHCPLTDDTRSLIGADEFSRMKPHAILINTARGGLVDEMALLDALRAGRIGGAAFDVLSEEPPVQGHVLLAPALLAQANFILTPHCAWASEPAMQLLADQLIDNLEAFAAGKPRNLVT
jgi:glycerate dehydrogenase